MLGSAIIRRFTERLECRLMGARPVHRIRQGVMRLRAGLCPSRIDSSPVRDVLSLEEGRLFTTLLPGDQAHALCVLRRCQRRQGVTPALAAAALLHDTGKVGAGSSLGWRVLIVILRGLGLEQRAASKKAGSWRHVVHLQLHHAELGAALCEQAGSSPRTVALVRWHDTPLAEVPESALWDELEALQSADEAC